MGTQVRFDFDKSLQDTLLHSPSFVAGLPGVLGRATAIKVAIDREAYAGVLPSIALNRLVATADRMQVCVCICLCWVRVAMVAVLY